ncbi:MAG: MFS transporter [Solirubrobacterales bacterium]|nr:MFS transporter [Solirubrobacterales bacterium]MBV9797564.1 MFS transporter [Solirubrobacterales bacterium]
MAAPATHIRNESGRAARPHLTAILLLSCLAQFMVILDVSVVNVALPKIRGALGFTEQDLQWVVNAYTVTFAGFLLLGGRAADLLGRRRVFVSGLVLFALASLAGGLAGSQGVLIAARAVQGLGGAVVAPASLSILTTTFQEGPARNRAVGIWGAMGGAGGAAGVLLGGVLTDIAGWRWILFINVPIGLIAALLALRFIVESRSEGSTRNFDLLGAVTATVGLSLLVLGIVRTDVTGWGSAQALGLIAGGLALLLVFVAIEGRFAKAPLMPLRIFASRTLTAANVVMLLVGAASFGMWFFLSLYLQQVLGYSPIRAGLAFLPMTVCIIVGSTLASRAVARVGAKPLLVAGLAFQAAGLALFTGLSADGSYLGDVLAPSLLTAIGIGCAFVPVTIAAVAGVARREAGLASGLVNTSRLVGGALGLAILAALATSRTNGDLRHGGAGAHAVHVALTNGFQLAFAVAAGFAVVGGLVALFGLPRIPARRAPPAPEEPGEETRATDAGEPVVAESVR